MGPLVPLFCGWISFAILFEALTLEIPQGILNSYLKLVFHEREYAPRPMNCMGEIPRWRKIPVRIPPWCTNWLCMVSCFRNKMYLKIQTKNSSVIFPYIVKVEDSLHVCMLYKICNLTCTSIKCISISINISWNKYKFLCGRDPIQTKYQNPSPKLLLRLCQLFLRVWHLYLIPSYNIDI